MSIHTELDIDRVLTGLRHTQPATGLEARIAARLSAASQAHTGRHPIFARICYAVPATAVAALAIIVLTTHLHRPTQQIGTLRPHTTHHPVILSEVVRGNLRTTQSKDPEATPAETTLHTFSTVNAPTQPDLDQIALAETLAPSRPASAMPLTPQEQLLARAASPGQPIELAELELVRQPFLEATAKAREQASLEQFVRRVLSPLVLQESFHPTPTAQTIDFTQPAPTNDKLFSPSTN